MTVKNKPAKIARKETQPLAIEQNDPDRQKREAVMHAEPHTTGPRTEAQKEKGTTHGSTANKIAMTKPMMTNALAPELKWKRQKAKLKAMFPKLNSDDLRYDYGMKEVMFNNLQIKLELSREELNSLLAKL